MSNSESEDQLVQIIRPVIIPENPRENFRFWYGENFQDPSPSSSEWTKPIESLREMKSVRGLRYMESPEMGPTTSEALRFLIPSKSGEEYNSLTNPIPEDVMAEQEAIVGTVQALEMKLDLVFQELTGTYGRYAAFAYAELLHGVPFAIFSDESEIGSWLSLIEVNVAQTEQSS